MALNLYKKIINAICAVFEFIAAVFIGVVVIIMSYQTVMRYLFNDTPRWAEELSLLLLIIICFIGMAVGVRHKIHITLNVFVDNRQLRKYKLAIEIFGKLFVMAIGVMMCIDMKILFDMLQYNRFSATNIPVMWVYVFPGGMGLLIVLITIYQIYDHFKLGTDEDQTKAEDFVS